MDQDARAALVARLVEVEERLDRVGKRLTAGYGSDSDREGWLLWLRRLTEQRDQLRAQLGVPHVVAAGRHPLTRPESPR